MMRSPRLGLFAVLSLVLSGAALAADNGLHTFTPPPGDTSVEYLAQIFGPVIDLLRTSTSVGTDGSGQTIIGEMMGVFNTAVLLLAMIFVLYTTIKGTVDSAHDGVLLGEKLSAIWVPIRTVAGSAMLLPLGSGYSLIQIAVFWLTLQGVGVASSIWNVAMDHLAVDGSLGYVSMPDARPLAANILRSEVCMAAMNKQFADEGRASRIEFITTSIPVAIGGAPDRNSQQYMTERYTDKGYSWRQTDRKINVDVCGSISYQDSPQSRDVSSSLRTPLLAAHSQAVRAMIDELWPVAASIVAYKTPIGGAIDAAVTRYRTTMQAAANQAIAASPDAAKSSFLQASKDAGWVAAGAWWLSMTKLNDSIQTAVNALPVSKASSIEDLETKETLIAYKDTLLVTEEYIKDRSGAPHAEATVEMSDIKIRSADDLWRVLSIPAMRALDTLTQRIAGANTSPVTQLRSIGNDIVTIGLVIKGGMFVVAGLLGGKDLEWTVGLGFNLLEALKTLTGSVEWLSNALWVGGAMLAYYLPAVPVIAWVTSVVRWLASVAEAVLAAPVMAAMHVHPGGDDLVGRAGPGYFLILAVVLTPALLLFALILSILMTYPAAALVNSVFLQMVSGIAGNSGVGLIGLVAFTALYVVMMTLAIQSCFSLVSAIPDGVMRYFASQAGAQGIVKSSDEAYSTLSGGAVDAGKGMTRGDVLDAAGRGKSAEPAKPSTNGISNADHLPQPKD